MNKPKTLLVLALILVLASFASAATFYVDKENTNCSDSKPGTETEPWCDVKIAISKLAPGQTLNIMGGTYNVANIIVPSGTASDKITIKNYQDEKVVLKSSWISGSSNRDDGFALNGISHVKIEGLEISNYYNCIPITGGSDDITLSNLVVHTCRSGIDIRDSSNVLVDGIDVSAVSEPSKGCGSSNDGHAGVAIRDSTYITIQNTVSHDNLDGCGSSGDADGFAVSSGDHINILNCVARDNDEDGLDFTTINGTVTNFIATGHNACGIKLWKRRDENNKFTLTNILSYNNEEAGIKISSPESITSGDYFINIYNSVFYDNGEQGIVSRNFNAGINSRLEIYNNIFLHNGYYNEEDSSCCYPSISFGENSNAVSNYNIFYDNWDGDVAWAGEGPNSLLGIDPKFVSASTNDFHLLQNSPAIDKGKDIPEVTIDFDGNDRPNGSSLDMGAFEFEPATSCNSNGVRETDEECDGSDFGTYTGSDSGIGMCYAFNSSFNSGSLKCNLDCTINTGNCVSYEGFGKITHGGASGTVYHVTSLADSGPGTLREGVEGYGKDNRYVVFDVAGEIHLLSDMYIRGPGMTVDGSSAPSPGITITKPTQTVETFYITGTHDIIVNYMRFEGVMGKEQHVSQNALTIGIDGDSPPDHHARNIVLDHITTRLGTDSSPDIWGRVSDITLSNNLFYQNWHPTLVAYGDNSQKRERISFHHNVYARNHERSPYLRGFTEEVDFVNNVVYNWGYWEGYGYGLRITGVNGTPDKINIVNNFFDSNASRDSAIICGDPPYNNIYISGNTIPPESSTACANTSTPFSISPAYQATTTPVLGICNSIDDAGTKYRIQEETDLINEIKLSMGCGASACHGTDTSCGTWPICQNCNSQDGCSGNSYMDYSCSGTSCINTTDNCTDCSCSCGGYNTTESTANGNCADGKDNDCDSQTDTADTECTQPPTCGNSIVDSGETCTNCPQDIQCPTGQICCTGTCTNPIQTQNAQQDNPAQTQELAQQPAQNATLLVQQTHNATTKTRKQQTPAKTQTHANHTAKTNP